MLKQQLVARGPKFVKKVAPPLPKSKKHGVQGSHQIKKQAMDSYSRIKFNVKTANRFRKYSGQIARSHSEALTLMMDFFDQNKISPSESLGPNMISLENHIKSRINAVIAIIRDIEKNQTKPTVAMLQALFEEAEPKKRPLILENNNFRADKESRVPGPENNDRT